MEHGNKGKIPWNKNKKEIRKGVLDKLSDSHKNQTAWNKGLKGYNSDYPRSKEWREKISKSHTGKKKPWASKNLLRGPAWNRGLIGYMAGDKHYNWKGGKSSLHARLRACSLWRIWRELVFLRDGFTCQNLNCEWCRNKPGIELHPHHINPIYLHPELAFKVENGITYCKGFHINSKTLHKRKEGKHGLLTEILSSR